MSEFVRVLDRDGNGRETLWQCSGCLKPFCLGWGSFCNRCIKEESRHRELISALEKLAKPEAPIDL